VELSAAQRTKAGAIAAIESPLVAALGRTLTWKVHGLHHFDDVVRSGRCPILAFWHGRILGGTLYWRDRDIVVMTSMNFDGEWIARIIARFGYRAARGSTSRGGARALVQLRRELAEGHLVAFTIDGPRGPARVAQPGASWLAGATGQPIVPFHVEASRYWTTRSWDRTQVPRPFSTMAIAIGEPIYVADTSEATVEAGRTALERSLGELERMTANVAD
jgi:lysophospholipid acyltransferase (LPLAT)-like uncharacterized protein